MESTSNAPASKPPTNQGDTASADGDPDAPVSEAADPVNPDVPPGTPSGDEIYTAMLDEAQSTQAAEDR